MTYLLSIDPGMSTGIVLGRFTNTKYERLHYWHLEGGLPAFRDWHNAHWMEAHTVYGEEWYFPEHRREPSFLPNQLTTVCEKFVPLPAPRTFKVAELEPIRIEGAVEALGMDPVWQRSSAMVLSNEGVTAGMTAKQKTARRKKASDDVLRRAGLWLTGKQVGHTDANDVNAAQKHALAYLRSINHLWTIQLLGE